MRLFRPYSLRKVSKLSPVPSLFAALSLRVRMMSVPCPSRSAGSMV